MTVIKDGFRIIWLIEHVAREMDAACIARCWLKAKFNCDISIHHIYRHANELMAGPKPELIVFPFFYQTSGFAINDYLATWPEVKVLNLAWEQIHYPAHEILKSPRDRFAKLGVHHNAWGPFYKKYLMRYGVPDDHILLNGHPAYQLYLEPYRNFFKQREQLAQQYDLDQSKKWVFFPENYRWAFTNDRRVASLVDQGADYSTIEELRYFCRESLKTATQWCNQLASHPDLEIIFRPRPAVNTIDLIDFMKKYVGPPNRKLRIIKEGTVREWILASDIVFSSYSTSLIEAAVANKTAYMIEPLPLPKGLNCSWNDIVPKVRTDQEFKKACTGNTTADQRLSQWAYEEMLSRGDSLMRLAEYTYFLASENSSADPRFSKVRPMVKRSKKKNYFNARTHEMDIFNRNDVDQRTNHWWQYLVDGGYISCTKHKDTSG